MKNPLIRKKKTPPLSNNDNYICMYNHFYCATCIYHAYEVGI